MNDKYFVFTIVPSFLTRDNHLQNNASLVFISFTKIWSLSKMKHFIFRAPVDKENNVFILEFILLVYPLPLTLVMLNKLRCQAHF